MTGAVDKASSGKAETGSGQDVGTRAGANVGQNPTADAGKDIVVGTDRNSGNPDGVGDAKAEPGQASASGVNGAAEENRNAADQRGRKHFSFQSRQSPIDPGTRFRLTTPLPKTPRP